MTKIKYDAVAALVQAGVAKYDAVALRRISLTHYVQGDPRGCALYILRPSDVPDGELAESYYSRGVAVY